MMENKLKQPIAIIDIGSNSIRMIVYDGLFRSPAILFNERVLAELGKTLSTLGQLNAQNLDMAFFNLQRFKAVADNMKAQCFVIATAALREASDGPEFTQKLKDELGLDVRIISGEEEAYLGYQGIISSFMEVDGVIGDLGGGSLELSVVEKSCYQKGESFPLGGLRLASGFSGVKALKKEIKKHIEPQIWLKNSAKDKNFYPIGGAWRSVAKYYISQTGYPLHLIHGLQVKAKDLKPYLYELAQMNARQLSRLTMISKRRRNVMATSALLMLEVLEHIRPKKICFSTFGVRDGLLYDHLSEEIQKQDPVLERCRYWEHQFSRFNNGEAIYNWSSDLIKNETPQYQRLYKAACLLNDFGWFEHRDYRAELSFRRLLTQRFGGGILHKERMMLACIAYVFYGESLNDGLVKKSTLLLSKKQKKHALSYGLAIRLARRLGGGPSAPIAKSQLLLSNSHLTLKIDKSLESFMGLHIDNIMADLAKNLDVEPQIEISNVRG